MAFDPHSVSLTGFEHSVVCALFAAGAELDLLPGRSVCGAADVSGDYGERRCGAAQADGAEGGADRA